MSVEFLVKLRDAAQMLVDVAEEQLEKMTPIEVKYSDKDFDALKWTTKSGTKGEYQQTTKDANNDSEVFQALRQILQDHQGFWQSATHKFWIHQGNAGIIDRRRKNQSSNPHGRMTENLHNIKKAGEKLTKS